MDKKTRKTLAGDAQRDLWKHHREIAKRILDGNKIRATVLLNDMVESLDKVLNLLAK